MQEEHKHNTWVVYLLACADGTLYCGVTNDLSRRLAQHNGELPGGARYTRGRRPVSLAGFCPCKDKNTALKRECLLKKLPKKRKYPGLLALLEEEAKSETHF